MPDKDKSLDALDRELQIYKTIDHDVRAMSDYMFLRRQRRFKIAGVQAVLFFFGMTLILAGFQSMLTTYAIVPAIVFCILAWTFMSPRYAYLLAIVDTILAFLFTPLVVLILATGSYNFGGGLVFSVFYLIAVGLFYTALVLFGSLAISVIIKRRYYGRSK